MKNKNLIFGFIFLSFLLGFYFVLGTLESDLGGATVASDFTPGEGYSITNYTKGGSNTTLNLTITIPTLTGDNNITQVSVEMPINVQFNDMANVSNDSGAVLHGDFTMVSSGWDCDTSNVQDNNYLNWTCVNGSDSLLGSDTKFRFAFNFSANNTATEEPIEWNITLVAINESNTILFHTNLDAQAPRTTLGNPADFYNETATGSIVFNHTSTDANLDTCELWGNWTTGWHLNESFINQTNGLTSGETNGSSNITIEDGHYVWSVYCNDSLNNYNTTVSNYTLTVDTTAPNITLDSPADFYNETATGSVVFNYTASDIVSDVDTCELWGNWTTGWHLNETFVSPPEDATNGSSNITIEEGLYVWAVYCNDTLGISNTTVENYTLVVDISAPVISLDNPANFYNESATGSVVFNYTANESGYNGITVDTCELWGNWSGGWHLNESFINPTSGETNGSSNITIADGLYVWSVYCNNTQNSYNNTVENYTLTVDTTATVVTLDAPSDNSYDTDGDVNFSFTAVEPNPDQCTLWFRSNETNWAQNDSTTYSNNVQTNIFVNLTNAVYVWNVECNDTVNKPAFASANRTLTVDTVVPPTPTLTAPTDTSINPRDSISYTCESIDATAGISKWTWTLTKPQEGGTVTKTGGEVTSNTQTFSGDDTNLAGSYTIKCEAEDKAGHKSSISSTFSVYYSHVTEGAGVGPSAAADIDLSTLEETTITEKQGVISTFTLDGITVHTLKIKAVDEIAGTVTIIIESDPIEITLKIMETKEVDVDADGTNDISVTLNKIVNGAADITTKRLAPLPAKEVPTEEVPPTEKPTEEITPTSEAPSKTWLWILIIVIVIVIGVGYWFIKKKYPKYLNIFLKESHSKG